MPHGMLTEAVQRWSVMGWCQKFACLLVAELLLTPELKHGRLLLLQSGASYMEAFLTVLKNVTKDETVQYVLAMVEELLTGIPGGHVACTAGF